MEHSALYDERLRHVDIKRWTLVPIPNDLAIRVISHYFDVYYVEVPLFNDDLFIKDLVEVNRHFCSSLLVNSLLAFGCKCYSPFDTNASAWADRFHLQADRELARGSPSNTLTTVVALLLIGVSNVLDGKDKEGLQFQRECVKVGKLMGLFGVKTSESSAMSWLTGYDDWTRAASYTAWGVFNWVSCMSLHFHICEIDEAPLLPKPRDLLAETQPRSLKAMRAARHAEILSKSGEFWDIVKGFLVQYYVEMRADPAAPGFQDFAEAKYTQLLHWASSLPPELERTDASDHDVVTMHIYFHTVITDVFRPLITSPSLSSRVRFDIGPFTSAEAIYAASINQLKRLCIMLRLKYPVARFSLIWHVPVIYLANAIFQESETVASLRCIEQRFYLDLILAGLSDLCVGFAVSGIMARAVVYMALQNGAIQPARANRVLKKLKEIDAAREAARSTSRVNRKIDWFMDLNLAMTDVKSARAEAMIDQLESLILSGDPSVEESDKEGRSE
ncbi:hypothetical protein CkaCkLH20_07132 [Colletotrichum karsti]|uniref:Nitrogen assimilation transcription factor nirA n=1 Tax=Colletotrichum karsti TaxID=1095194 RepID=A0A9P6LK68_9PEZI|nr:uncharacterized protein CkaCkLH20_07132 [Colletotrichum karsti]KAF9875312.1 hypothetical protein CkaCkLH20_07132 [Colletotrichum karsti]